MEAKASLVDRRARDLSADRITNFVLWRIPWVFIAVGAIWTAQRGTLWTIALAWIGSACLANAVRCRRVHCSIMGPSFLILALVAGGKTLGWFSIHWNVVWAAAGIIVLLAFLPEWLGKRYFGQSPAC
ncbi:MAG: hypothetical protein V3V82_00255 [Acidimicrobiia bacterium]